MKIYTSYFGNMKALTKQGIVCVGIAQRPPYWFKGESIKQLAPSEQLFKDSKTITDSEYTTRYMEQIKNIQPRLVQQKLHEMYGGKDVALLCFEKDRNQCHRDLAAKWLESKLEIEVKEFVAKNLDN